MLEILFSNERAAAIRLNGELYYIHLDVYMPEIFDENCNKLTISNIDTWVNNKTRQKHNYPQIIELCKAYHKGYVASLANRDPDKFLESLVQKIVKTLFTSELASKYVNEYWIECTTSNKIGTRLIAPIIKKYDFLKQKLSIEVLEDYVNRIRKIANSNTESHSVTKMFTILKFKVKEPNYPNTSDLDHKLISMLKHDVKLTDSPNEILLNLSECEKKFL
jgi:ATP-dependent exoDNAse (exonuclease V) beta subunit